MSIFPGRPNSWYRLRGNASGRNGVGRPKPWLCAGCNKIHAGSTERTIALDHLSYCNRQYFKMLDAKFAAEAAQ